MPALLPADPQPTPAPPARFPHRALWRVAVFGWGTFGLYYIHWAWRNGRARQAMGHAGVSPRLHGLAFLFVPVGAVLLARLGRLADEVRGRAAGRHWPLLAVLFLVAGIGSGSAEVGLPFLLLLPLPVVLVQRAMNAPWQDERPSGRPRWRDLPGALLCVLAFVGTWENDHAALRAWISPSAVPGAAVSGPQRDYRLVPPDLGWALVPSGTNGEPDADLELQSRFRRAWIVVYRVEEPNTDLDDTIDVRLSRLEEAASVTGFTESRTLELGADGPVVTSRAWFETSDLFGRDHVHVRAIRTGDRLYEAVGWADSPRYAPAVARVLDSFELVAEPAP
jgi:hypothetical protein